MFNLKKILLGLVLILNLGCEAEIASYRDLAKFLGFATGTTVVLAGRLKFKPVVNLVNNFGRNTGNTYINSDRKVLDDPESVHIDQKSGQWVIVKFKSVFKWLGFTRVFGQSV